MHNSETPAIPQAEAEQTARRALVRLGMSLGWTVPRSELKWDATGSPTADRTIADLLREGAKKVGITLSAPAKHAESDIWALVADGFPVAMVWHDRVEVLEQVQGRKLEGHRVTAAGTEPVRFSSGDLKAALQSARVYVAGNELECDSMSAHRQHAPHSHAAHGSEHHHEHAHVDPLHRFFALLNLDRGDIRMLILFAAVAGALTLATPLAVESLVNVVSWGTYVQPLIVLALMLFTCMGLAGVLKVLQTIVAETIQRRQFVRLVGDLAHRFPRANQDALAGQYPRELANRVFDILTIQKATATLLLDGVSIVLSTALGLVLLAFYHPFLLGFDLVLCLAMIGITWSLGRGGVRTAIEESITKYRVVHWLQDVIATPEAFKITGGETLAVQRASELTADYIKARQRQFRVVIRQVSFAVGLQVIASTAVLSLGGWLVINGQLTLGQLVASELVVTVVVGGFAKAGKSIETFYDLMAAVDKVGHLLDITTDPHTELGAIPAGPARVVWSDLMFRRGVASARVPATEIAPGSRVAIVGDDPTGGAMLATALAGLSQPTEGEVVIANFSADVAALRGGGAIVAYAGGGEVFHGSLGENVDLGRVTVTVSRVRECLEQMGLSDTIHHLEHGLRTVLQTDGYPLSRVQIAKLILARAIAGLPRLLVIDRLLDELSEAELTHVWQTLSDPQMPWTLVVVTN
ncbi:MAG: ATP-binding cassette domain-containing protein, partial [Planctomycetales bacterium]|nr:ATP-binding cassette domain-containing protein [Planctomycetales bacterium]